MSQGSQFKIYCDDDYRLLTNWQAASLATSKMVSNEGAVSVPKAI
jgi:hypothetical protein